MERLSFDHNRVIVGASDPNIVTTNTKNNNNNNNNLNNLIRGNSNNLRFGQTTPANVPATTTNQTATVNNLKLSTATDSATITGSIQVKIIKMR